MPSAADLLSPSGPIATALARDGFAFEPRPQQLAMAAAVDRTMADRGRLLVEAGTGVGKSFAYLVPAILRCLQSGERVIVATNTIALQEQLIRSDIPLLHGTLEHWGLAGNHTAHSTQHTSGPRTQDSGLRTAVLHPVLVKGRGNYISIRRLELASRRSLSLFPDAASRQTLHAIEDWAYTTHDGSLATLPPEVFEAGRPAVWDRVQSDAGNCMGRSCPSYKKCFYQNARRDMDRGNLLVTNHALFFSDLGIRARSGDEAGFLPPYDHLILDEAHNIEDVASEHFGISLTESRVSHLLNLLYHPRTGRGYLAGISRRIADSDKTDAAHRAVLDAHDAARAFFDSLSANQRRTGPGGGRLSPTAADELSNPLTPAMRSVTLRLKALREALPGGGGDDEADGDKPPDEDRYELNSYILRATGIADDAEALIKQSLPGYVYWIEASDESMDQAATRSRRGPTKVRLACSPIEVAPLLREHLFAKNFSITLTSATLATSSSSSSTPQSEIQVSKSPFSLISTSLGCDDADTLQLDSPFDYAKQVRFIVDLSMPAPTKRATDFGAGGAKSVRSASGVRSSATDDNWPPPDPDTSSLRHSVTPSLSSNPYITTLASKIIDHAKSTDGGAFILFTSFADLFAVADTLPQLLNRLDHPMPLLVQGRGGSRSALLDAFKQDPRSILLGAASFWQGVDVRGQALRNVIIVRLPFDPPDRPLTQARLERIAARGGNGFMLESLPRAIIRFKQGFGRLIRSTTDTGRIVVLDPRIVTARYGRAFIDALPPGIRPEVIED